MLIAYEGLFLFEMALLVYCVLNIITTPEAEIRNLPKLGWLLLVIILPLAGGIAWLVAGRPVGPTRVRPAKGLPYRGNTGVPPDYDRPGRATARNPDDDAAFMASLQQRAEEQRRRGAEEARELRRREDEAP